MIEYFMFNKLKDIIGLGKQDAKNHTTNNTSLKEMYIKLGLNEGKAQGFFPNNDDQFKLKKNMEKSLTLIVKDLNIIDAIQVANVCKFQNIVLVGFDLAEDSILNKTSKNITIGEISNHENTLFVAKSSNNIVKTISILSDTSKNSNTDFIFIKGKLDFLLRNVTENTIGFAISKSIFDGRILIKKSKINTEKSTNEEDLIKRIQGGQTNFQDMLKIFDMFATLKNSPMASMMKGLDLNTVEKQMSKLKVIIQSMTTIERKKISVLKNSDSRIERVAKGAKVTIEQVLNLIKGLEHIRANGSNIQNIISNPSMLQNMFKDTAK